MKLSKSLITAISVAAAGAIVVFMVHFCRSKITQNYEENQPYILVCDNLKYKTTVAHLWFEEYMAGDVSINPEKDVISKMESSIIILDGVLEGKETELGLFVKIEDADIKQTIRNAKEQINTLQNLTRLRWNSKLKYDEALGDSLLLASLTTSNAGSDLDQQFDGAYENIQISLEELKTLVKQKLANDISSTVTLTGFILSGISIIFMVMAFLLYKLQNKNEIETNSQRILLANEEVKVAKMTVFADHIGQGNYDAFLEIDNIKSDSLAVALTTMRDKLKRIAEEDTRRNWINLGLAKMSDILRTSYQTPDQLYFGVTSYIITYLEANQGGLFLINELEENNKFIEMASCVAFDRRKFLQKRIEFGEGVIGRCLLESATIYMKEIPDEYISITSGLGGANPKNLLLVPLKLNETLFGVLEIASFKAIEPYQIELVEKLAENLASSISTVKINERTKMLLEKSQIQAEEMRAQEEEMRQNMEEISATQEEMRRKEQEYIKVIDELKGRE